MSILVDEIGSVAAENVGTILRDTGTGSWGRLVEGGWAALGADPDAGMDVRAIQEVARVTGRYSLSTPLIPTLLAGRWFQPSADQIKLGIGIALPRDGQLAVPYFTGSMVMLDASGDPLSLDGHEIIRDSFSEAMPFGMISVTESAPALSAENEAELHAVLAAVAVGCADAVLDRSVRWSGDRTQFGQAIRAFQAVRHMLANMHILREQAWTAAIACANEPGHAARWCRQACALAMSSAELGIQVHGGAGFTWEVGLQRFLCHVLQIQSLTGAVS